MIVIKHSLKGRIRLKYKNLIGSPSLASAVEEALRSLKGVSGARCSHIGGSIVVNYDCTVVLPSELIKAVTEVKPAPRRTAKEPACKRQGCVCVRNEEPKADTAPTEFGILSAVLGAFFIRTKNIKAGGRPVPVQPAGAYSSRFLCSAHSTGCERFRQNRQSFP
ncbi:MAG: heavy-metal-associated domain-containing protein [Geovibrio sp.]|nr:heavy-metal-associated domain-containing protein [Geovibrio sp.]